MVGSNKLCGTIKCGKFMEY